MIPKNLVSLHAHEEQIREQAQEIIGADHGLQLHLMAVEKAMGVASILKQYPTGDEDLKVVQVFGMRIFNALGASTKMALSEYYQSAALSLRDIVETTNLIELFHHNRDMIKYWRERDDKNRNKYYSPAKVRIKLDEIDGSKLQEREAQYKLFSQIAAHPTMLSDRMMRPDKDGDAVMGPFFAEQLLKAELVEMAKLAIKAGQNLVHFYPDDWHAYPDDWHAALATQHSFIKVHQDWLKEFFPELYSRLQTKI